MKTAPWEQWRNRIDTARTFRSVRWAPAAREFTSMYQGYLRSNPIMPLTELIPVNLASTYIRALIATLYAQDPTFVVLPTSEASEEDAETLQLLLNYFWREFGLKGEVKAVLLDALLTGWGWMEYGYQAEFGVEEPLGSTVETAKSLGQRVLQGVKALLQEEKPQEDRLTRAGQVVEFNEYVKKESLYARRISPFTMLCPWDINRVRDWPWLAYELFFDEEDIQHLPGIPKEKLRQLQPYGRPGRSSGTAVRGTEGLGLRSSSISAEPSSVRYRLVKIWDKRSQQRLLYGDGLKEMLKVDAWPYEFEGFPLVPLVFQPVPETDAASNVYPLSLLHAAKPLLDEMTRLFTNMSENRKRFATKVLVDAKVPDEVKRKLADADLSGIVECPGIGMNPNLIRELKFLTNTATVETEYRLLTELMETMLHLRLLNAQPSPGVDTATESNNLQQALVAQLGEMQNVVEDFLVEGGRRLVGMRNFITREIIMQVTGESTLAQDWVRVTPAEIRGEYKVTIHAGSTVFPKDLVLARKQLGDFANQAFAFQQAGLLQIDFQPIMRQWVRTFSTIVRDLDKVFPSSQAQEQQVALQENQFLNQNLPQLVHPGDNDAVHIEVHGGPQGSQADSTLAKAQHIAAHAQRLHTAKTPAAQAAVPNATRSAGTLPDMLMGLRSQGAGTGAETNQLGLNQGAA